MLAVQSTGLIPDAKEVPAWVASQAGDLPVMVAIDAPTIIRNATDMRPAEKLMHRYFYFGRQHAGCYPSNLGSAFAERTLRLSGALEAMGIRHASRIEARTPGRYQIEVHLHAATLHLLGLDRIVKYKKGRLAERRDALAGFQSLLSAELSRQESALRPCAFPPLPGKGRELKGLEDQTDAILAAYIGAWWWYWGDARTLVVGDEDTGFIVVSYAPQPQNAAKPVRRPPVLRGRP